MRQGGLRSSGGRSGPRARWLLLVPVLLAGGLTIDAGVSAPPASGAVLIVRQSGLPWGVSGRITVRGPNGYVRRLRDSAILRKLRRGRYYITARTVVAAYRTYSPTVDRPSVRLRRTSRVTVRVRYVRLPLRPDQIAVQITTGGEHTCVLTAAGGVKCWGWNQYGQLGDGTTKLRSVPVTVHGLASGVRSVSAGDHHTCAVTTGGAALCWGRNSSGELGDGTYVTRLTPVLVSGLSSGVAEIAASGGLWETDDPDDLAGEHTCALTSAGAVLCWGDDFYGQLGNGPALASFTPVAVSGLSSGVTAIAAGGLHSCAVKSAGGVVCWGQNDMGQLGNGTKSFGEEAPVAVSGLTSGVTAIDGGGYHTCAIVNGGARCWGDNYYGQVGDGTRGLGNERTTPVAVSGVSTGVTSISAGGEHTCALVAEGAKCWGANFSHQLGAGTDATWQLTTVRQLGTGAGALSSNAWHGCAIMKKTLEFPQGSTIMWGKPIWCWGGGPFWGGGPPTGEGPVPGIFGP